MYSIRRFLGLGLMLVVGGGMLLMSAATYHIVSHEVEERFDAQLSQSARLLRAMITAPIEAGQDPQDALSLHLQTQDYLGLEAGIHGHHYETKISFQVLDESGKVLFRSIGAPEKAFDERELGFSYHWHDDQKWRIFRIHDERVGLWLLVGERADVRGEIVRELATLALLGNAFGLPFIVVLIWSVLYVGLRPLIRIAESIAGRAPDRLTPINSRGLPRELAGIVEELNRLLNRLGLAMEREKRFTADAAHELRTPLAVLRVHAQNAASSSDPELRQRSLSQLTRAVDRATHLVEQLLALARLEPGDVPAERHPVDFLRVARDEVAQLAPKALNKQQELWLECDESNLRVLASEVPLSMLLRNLIDNAIRYGREGGEVRVSLQRDGDTVQLHVCDDGPGVPAALRERIFERFYQAAPGKGQGAGLGLSIVRRIAELYGAQMHADEAPSGGLCVIVSFPLVD